MKMPAATTPTGVLSPPGAGSTHVLPPPGTTPTGAAPELGSTHVLPPPGTTPTGGLPFGGSTHVLPPPGTTPTGAAAPAELGSTHVLPPPGTTPTGAPAPGLGSTYVLPPPGTTPTGAAPELGSTFVLPGPGTTPTVARSTQVMPPSARPTAGTSEAQGAQPPQSATMVSNPPSQRPTGPAALKATVMGLGMTPPTSPSQPPAAPAQSAAASFKGTMIGMAPPTPAPAGQAQSPSQAPPAPQKSLRGTMLGMAPPKPPQDLSSTVAPNTTPGLAPAAPPTAPIPAQEDLGSTVDIRAPLVHKKTMMGVARPGIAPLNPGVQKKSSDPPPWQPPPQAPAWQPPAPDAGAPESVAGVPRPLRIPASAALAIVGAAALLTAAIVALLLYRSRGALEATLGTGSDGHDKLGLSCPGCPDGATVSVGSARGTFKGGRAEVPLGQKLAVGENTVAVELERRSGKIEQVELKVPVDFRVKADTTGFAQAPPRIVVRVEAVPKTAVVVDGKPLSLSAAPGGTETGSAEIDVVRALSGSSSVVGLLERKIPYVVTPQNGTPTRGDVSVRIGVTPLAVQAPGPSIVIETATFVLAGRTSKDATVTVEGRPITVDASGAFAQMMSVSSLGETNITVRADSKDQAPRLVPVRVRRVQTLAAEATRLKATATTSYAAISRDPDSQRGISVALDGSVVEARSDAFTTVILVDVKSGCQSAPCLARVSVGEKVTLKAGSSLSAYGTILGAVEGPHQGTRIPAIAADFVLKGRP